MGPILLVRLTAVKVQSDGKMNKTQYYVKHAKNYL